MVVQCHSTWITWTAKARWGISLSTIATISTRGNKSNVVSDIMTNCLFISNKKISAASYYPGRGDTTHPLASLDPENRVFHNPNVDDSETETDDDDDEEIVELALKNPGRFAQVMAVEVSLRQPFGHFLISSFTAAHLAGFRRCRGAQLGNNF